MQYKSNQNRGIKISSLIYCPFNEPAYLDIASEIINDLIKEGESVSVLLLSSRKSLVEFYSSRILRFARRITPESEFVEYCKGNNVNVFTAEITKQRSLDFLNNNSSFQESLDSSLISFFSESGPFNGKKHKRIKRKYLDICFGVYSYTFEILEKNKEINRIFVPNGRMADQRTFLIASKQQNPNIKTIFFEIGFRKHFYFVGEQSLLDRVAMQTEIRHSDYSPFLSAAAIFFESRRIDEGINEFIAGWKVGIVAEDESLNAQRVTLFNSSNDEFMSLGAEWNDSDWDSQWQALEQVARYFLENGYTLTLRMHPNGANKSRRERAREKVALDAFREKVPLAKVHKPQDKINSYNLIRQSDVIVVWNSTIGLESSYMGKPVICLNASEWDLSVPNFRVRSAADLNKLIETMPKVDTEAALKFIAGRISLDKPLRSNYFRNLFLNVEEIDIFFRLARITAGSRKLKYRNLFKLFFHSSSTPLYRFLKRISSKIQG